MSDLPSRIATLEADFQRIAATYPWLALGAPLPAGEHGAPLLVVGLEGRSLVPPVEPQSLGPRRIPAERYHTDDASHSQDSPDDSVRLQPGPESVSISI
jgi:hypothetical protein